MEVIGHDGHRNQVNPEVGRLKFELIFDPDFAVIEVLVGDRVVSKKETPSHDPGHNVEGSDFVWIEDFRTG
jgi:hypothetical protein